ncbi:MAG: ATP-binding protein [Verrucomicrobia bacterium]|nr:ATP-binding protein [Verrucomicrobiota bacterium]
MKPDLFEPAVDQLLTLLEEGARASKRSVRRFVEPMHGTLRRAQNKRHQIVFGRRGSGKSSLLYKTAHELAKKGYPVAYVDLEPFKGHQYPDILISVLLAALLKLEKWLASSPAEKGPRAWWTAGLTRKKTEKQAERERLLALLSSAINDLKKQLHLADSSKLVNTIEQQASKRAEKKSRAELGAAIPGLDDKLEAEIAREQTQSSKTATTEVSKRSKIDYLHRKILDYQEIFAVFSELTASDSYLFLDDLYHIVRADQPRLLDYFHRIAKGQHLWLKIGTIKHRSTWYVHSPQPMGLKTSDDADDINLDLTLEKFSIAQKFLSQILDAYIEEAGSSSRATFISDGGLERLVIASGGVPRDFLALLRKAIVEARERLTRDPAHPRGMKIGAEDVNMAAGEYGDSKKEEFQKDTLEDETQLKEAFEKIRRFCLQRNRSNIFLIEQDASTPEFDRVQELIDLRLVHHVKSRVTVSDTPGKAYRALLLDFSQYTGARRQYDIDMIEFWKGDRQTLRKNSFIYDPRISLTELQREIEELRAKSETAESNDRRQKMLPF